MDWDIESLRQQIPYYLTAQDKEILLKELKAIASGGSAGYTLSEHHDTFKEEMLQGDGWTGFQLFVFESGERRTVSGLILSNSCDVSIANKRDIPAKVIFAPLTKLSGFRRVLEKTELSPQQISSKISSIRAQKTTNVFYLPAGGPLQEEYIVRLDEAHSMPVSRHAEGAERRKMFTLSNTGFYMLLFKLTIHFCRFHEEVNRKHETA